MTTPIPKRGPVLCSIGYDGLDEPGGPEVLKTVVEGLDVTLWDVRYLPYGRVRAGFGGRQLAELLGGDRYRWEGKTLGGKIADNRGPTRGGLAMLRRAAQTDRILMLCACVAPSACHCFLLIAKRLLPDVDTAHIFYDARGRVPGSPGVLHFGSEKGPTIIMASAIAAALAEQRRTREDQDFAIAGRLWKRLPALAPAQLVLGGEPAGAPAVHPPRKSQPRAD